MEDQYVVITTISSFKHRYVVPVSQLDYIIPTTLDQYQLAVKDMVKTQVVEEFSQEWLGETIIDSWMESEEDILNRFEKELDYAKSWTTEQKLAFIKNSIDEREKNA